MIQLYKIRYFIILGLFIISTAVYSVKQTEQQNKPVAQRSEFKNTHWIFTGMVYNGLDERFAYYFKMQRQDNQFHIQAALLNGYTRQLIFSYDQTKTIDSPKDLKWKVGRAFLYYNPVNANWSFGVKEEQGQGQGFNFKLNMLETPDEDQKTKTLCSGLDVLVRQTSRINGHIQTGVQKEEQFVTSSHSWYSKMWRSDSQQKPHKIKTLFCRLNDESGFYAVKLKESDAVQAAFAGWRDASGNPVKMSQFVKMKPVDDEQWLVNISLPKLDFTYKNLLPDPGHEKKDSAGFFNGEKKGFCFMSRQLFN